MNPTSKRTYSKHIYTLKTAVATYLLLCSVAVIGQQEDIWIDVRTEAEYSEDHLSGAFNIPFDKIHDQISDITRKKNANINLYCRSGRRSGIAKKTLVALGYLSVTNSGSMAKIIEQGIKKSTRSRVK